MEKNISNLVKEERIKEYCSGFLLNLIVDKDFTFSVVLEGDDKYLEELFVYMVSKGYLKINDRNHYEATQEGVEKHRNFKAKYQEYLAHFDVFCAVDLERGEFAFEKFFELDDETWIRYINQDRFEDLRIAVANFKKMDAREIIFLSYINEGEFNEENDHWQFDLLSGLIWDEISEIIDNSLTQADLAYTTSDGEEIGGEEVLKDVIEQGAMLCKSLYNKEVEENNTDNDGEDREDEVIVTYENYYNPFFVSPLWFVF